jgi:hypothetical protein
MGMSGPVIHESGHFECIFNDLYLILIGLENPWRALQECGLSGLVWACERNRSAERSPPA